MHVDTVPVDKGTGNANDFHASLLITQTDADSVVVNNTAWGSRTLTGSEAHAEYQAQQGPVEKV